MTKEDPAASWSLIANPTRLSQLATDPDPFATDHSSIAHLDAILSGYFRGLPDGTKWHQVFESLDSSFHSIALAPMLGRWMSEEPESAMSWLKELPQDKLPAVEESGTVDPFAE
ncbi:hypothetical protein N9A94_05575, partial [Akkermansiaceae bacterium]|nr:hypothetical protein [Akkermansiaceae bacterium]